MKLLPTASQTVGPYLHIGLTWLTIDRVAARDCPGQQLIIEGHVIDGDRRPITDALIEVWQANVNGKYAHPEDKSFSPLTPNFRGFGRIATDGEGRFHFGTIKPGQVADLHGGRQAPHLMISIFMRGLLKRLVTRVYFPDEPANDDDAVLRLVPPERRGTLVARWISTDRLEWNVVLQGRNETVFFDC
jgi:protocatechuate 3,4-dioxygenase alpha subunit